MAVWNSPWLKAGPLGGEGVGGGGEGDEGCGKGGGGGGECDVGCGKGESGDGEGVDGAGSPVKMILLPSGMPSNGIGIASLPAA